MKTTFLSSAFKKSGLAGLLALCPFSSATAALSSPGSGEIAIYSETLGGEFITTAEFVHDFDESEREDLGSFSRAGADITLNRAGHYLAIYDARFKASPETGTEQRVEVQSNLNLAGADLPIGWSQGYIRRQQGHLDAITTGMGVFEASANDILQLQSVRTDTTTAGTVSRFGGETSLQLVKLDEVNMRFARLRLTANQTGPATDGVPVKVLYDGEDELDAGFSYAAGDLTLVDPGKYLVIANTYVVGPNDRRGIVQELSLDGVAIPGTRTNFYLRGNQSTVEGAAGIGTIIETSSPNQLLSVSGEFDGGGGVSDFIADRCALTVVKLPSAADGTAPVDPEFIRLSSTTNQNINTTADIVFDSQDEVDGDFGHAASTAPITVATGGDYLFLGSYYGADDEAARGLSNPGWAVNGTRLARGQSGRYTRNLGPPEFGNTLGLVATDLAPNDEVKMVTRAIAAGGTNDANPITLQGVRLASLFTGYEVFTAPATVSVEEGGAAATYEILLGADPAAGSVEITVTADPQTEVSLNGLLYSPTVSLSFTVGGVPQTVRVRALDDADIESFHVGTISHEITATGDPTNYPTSLPVRDVLANITDNDVVPVVAVDDVGTSGASEDATTTEAILAPQASLLANDTDGFNNTVVAFDARSNLGARVMVQADGTFTYDPTGAGALQALPLGSSAVDSFDYTAADGDGNTSTATVTITVDGANDIVTAADDVVNDGPLELGTFTSHRNLTANDGIVGGRSAVTFPAGSDLRLLPGKIVSQFPDSANPPGGGFAGNAFDGNVETFTHTTTDENVDHFWQVDLGQTALLESITLANRDNCCGSRLRDITVRVLDAGGVEVFNSGLLNVENALGFNGGADETLFVDFAGPISGRTVLVERQTDVIDTLDARTDNNNSGDVSILSLSEVTLIGSVPGSYLVPSQNLILDYDASRLVDNGRWENKGLRGGTAMDWILTDITFDPSPVTSRNGILAAYEWDALSDDATLSAGASGSIHDNVPGADLSDGTWEFWVKPANTSTVMTLFETGGGSGFGMIINNGVLEAATELDGDTQSGSYVSYDLVADPEGLVGGDPTTEFNQYAAAITVNGGLALYVNGVLVDETTSGVSNDWDGGDGAGLGGFGEDNHGGFTNSASGTIYDATFLGQMAIVRFYSGTLAEAEILQNFQAVDAGSDVDGDTIAAVGVIDGTGAFVPNNSQATLASGALVTMNNSTGGFDYDPNGAFDLLSGQTTTDTF